MVDKGATRPLGATVSGIRPGSYPLGSALSRAAARSLLAARRASEDEQGFQVVSRSILDGSRINFEGLAERLNAARRAIEAQESPGSHPAIDPVRESEGTWEERLGERIRKARERVAKWKDGQDSTP